MFFKAYIKHSIKHKLKEKKPQMICKFMYEINF